MSPYQTNDELPSAVRGHLPEHAQDIYREAFNHAWSRYRADEAVAHRVAWAAVKRSYVKLGDEWVPRPG
ncbi:MAG: ChaB family protein [Myxococcaceae bacterium]